MTVATLPPSSSAGIDPVSGSSSWSSRVVIVAVSGTGLVVSNVRRRSMSAMSCSTWLSDCPMNLGSLSSSSKPTRSRMSVSASTPNSLAPASAPNHSIGSKEPTAAVARLPEMGPVTRDNPLRLRSGVIKPPERSPWLLKVTPKSEADGSLARNTSPALPPSNASFR